MNAEPALEQAMTADEFFARAETADASGRYELVNGARVRMPSSVRTDVERKLIDYFAIPSVLQYLTVFADDERVLHHGRRVADARSDVVILGREAAIDLSPPGFSVTVEDLLTA